LFPGQPQFKSDEVAVRANLDPEVIKRLWRAMGFTEANPDEAAFYADDIEALTFASDELALGAPVDTIVRETRVMNAAMSRVAESIADDVAGIVLSARELGLTDDEAADWLTSTIDVDRFARIMGYFLRRQLRAALWRKLAVPADQVNHATLTIGFVDLVRFTAITEEVAEEELDALVTRFEEVAHDRITDNGGRMIKMIGDEVMFVADDPAQGIGIALDLVEAYSNDEQLPSARAGVAYGGVLTRDGDYFGPVVNLASRIVDVARPDSVVTSEVMQELLVDHEGLAWRRLPPKRLKGIGRTSLWLVRRDSDGHKFGWFGVPRP
jgi:adenylate cyclase